MTIVGWLGWGLFGMMALVYISFSRHMARRVEAMGEYVEFLLQNRTAYEDHRQKYCRMLRETISAAPQSTLHDLAVHSKRAVDRMAEELYKHACVSNAFGRGTVDKWVNADNATEVVRTHLSQRANDGT